MTKTNPMNPKVDAFINKSKQWREETELLRKILLDCPLTEAFKWGKPCYMHENSNIAIIQGFKEYFALMFFKGALLKDPQDILIKIGENTQAGRQIRFKDKKEISELETVLRAYINEAIEVEKAGLKVEFQKSAELQLPEELHIKLGGDPAFQAAFEALTPGRQRAYAIHFSAPKQSKTRESRIEKCRQQILEGKGLNDR